MSLGIFLQMHVHVYDTITMTFMHESVHNGEDSYVRK